MRPLAVLLLVLLWAGSAEAGRRHFCRPVACRPAYHCRTRHVHRCYTPHVYHCRPVHHCPPVHRCGPACHPHTPHVQKSHVQKHGRHGGKPRVAGEPDMPIDVPSAAALPGLAFFIAAMLLPNARRISGDTTVARIR